MLLLEAPKYPRLHHRSCLLGAAQSPRDDESVRVRKLPDIAPAPVADGLSCAKVSVLLQPLLNVVALPDVDDFAAFDPLRTEHILSDGRLNRFFSYPGLVG